MTSLHKIQYAIYQEGEKENESLPLEFSEFVTCITY